MTKQEAFDKVVKHLLKQGEPAFDGDICCYRTDDGKKCAAGCLIPDELYDPAWEGKAAFTLPQHLFGQASEIVDALQAVHDDATAFGDWLTEWKRGMIALAVKKGLDASLLTNPQ
jgi:hypothetical protein